MTADDHGGGWSFETLKALMDERDRRYGEIAAAKEKAVEAALAAASKAVEVAEANSERWRGNANEWRAAMDDRENKFSTKSEINIQFAAAEERLRKLEMAGARQGGEFDGLSLGWKMFIGAAGLILTAMTIINIVIYAKAPEVRSMVPAQVVYAPAPAKVEAK